MIRMNDKKQKVKRILVFAGTSEGRRIAEFLSEKGMIERADFCVATEYGRTSFDAIRGVRIREGRLSEAEIRTLISSGTECADGCGGAEAGEGNAFDLIIDATHPYADAVTENIRRAAKAADAECIRVMREDSGTRSFEDDGLIVVRDAEEAAARLDETEDRFFLTTGIRDIEVFSRVHGFTERAVARVLPSCESLRSCFDAGLKAKNIVCMQGPFTEAMNAATMEQYGLEWLVTKSAGREGGFEDKISLADRGYKVIVIKRPDSAGAERGCSLEEVKEVLERIL